MKVKDKNFVKYISEEDIQKRIRALAKAINKDYKDKDPLFIAVLNGSFMFAADLMKKIKIASQISFIKLASYEAMQSTGNITNLVGLQENIFKRNVIVLEDIIDTGKTMKFILDQFEELGPETLEITSLLVKPEAVEAHIPVKYLGFEIPNKFVVGYGLDYDGYGRNLADIYQLKD